MLPIYGQVSDRIRVLDAELTREMLKEPAQWQLESILRRATSFQQYIDRALHALELVGLQRETQLFATTLPHGAKRI